MDSRKFKITFTPENEYEEDVEADDVLTHEGFVVFLNDSGEKTTTKAMFNSSVVFGVTEIKEENKND